MSKPRESDKQHNDLEPIQPGARSALHSNVRGTIYSDIPAAQNIRNEQDKSSRLRVTLPAALYLHGHGFDGLTGITFNVSLTINVILTRAECLPCHRHQKMTCTTICYGLREKMHMKRAASDTFQLDWEKQDWEINIPDTSADSS